MCSVVTQLLLPSTVRCVCLGPDRARQLVAYGSDDGVARVYLFDAYAPASQLTLPRAHDAVTALALDTAQRTALVGSEAGEVCMGDVATERVVHVFAKRHARRVTAVDVLHNTSGGNRGGSSGGSSPHCYAASVSCDGALRLWDTRTRARVQLYAQQQQQNGNSSSSSGGKSSSSGEAGVPLHAVCFAPSGVWLATGCALGVVRLYDLVAGKLAYTLPPLSPPSPQTMVCVYHHDAITALRFHSETSLLAVGSRDGAVSVWSLRTGAPTLHSAFVVRHGNTTTATAVAAIEALCMCGHELVVTTRQGVYTHSLRGAPRESSDTATTATAVVVTRLASTPCVPPTTTATTTAVTAGTAVQNMTDMVYSSYDEEVWLAGCGGAAAYTARLPLRRPRATAEDDDTSNTTASAVLRDRRNSNSGNNNSSSRNNNATTTAAKSSQATPSMQLLMPFAQQQQQQHDAVASAAARRNSAGKEGGQRDVATATGDDDDGDVAFVVDDGAAVLALLRHRATRVRQLLRMWRQHSASSALAAATAAAREDEEGEHAVCDFLLATQQQQQRQQQSSSSDTFAPATAAELADVLDMLCALCEDGTRDAALRRAAVGLLGCLLQQQHGVAAGVTKDTRDMDRSSSGSNDARGDDAATAALLQTCAQRLCVLAKEAGALGECVRTLLASLPTTMQR